MSWQQLRWWKHVLLTLALGAGSLLMLFGPAAQWPWLVGLGLILTAGIGYVFEELVWLSLGRERVCPACRRVVPAKTFRLLLDCPHCGSPFDPTQNRQSPEQTEHPAAETLDAELQALASRPGSRLQAIKRYRDRTGASLAEAKRVIEQLSQSLSPPPELSAWVREAADQPQLKLEAIKRYRDETGVSLAEAKAAIEAYQARR